jgi:plasmid maintenance system antidote protein VapI
MKLTREDVLEIRRLFRDGKTQTAIARQFHMSQTDICSIVHGKIHKLIAIAGEHEWTGQQLRITYPRHFIQLRQMLEKRKVARQFLYDVTNIEDILSLLRRVDDGELITRTQAAHMLSLTNSRIGQLVQKKRLNEVEVGTKKYLLRKEVEAFRLSYN